MSQSPQPTILIEPINSAQPPQSPDQIQATQLASSNRIDPPSGTQEVWASLEPQGFPNYEVSTFGRVRNIKRQNILKGAKNAHGYRIVMIPDRDGRKCLMLFDILVATAFHPKPEGKNTVDHRDRIRDNDYAGNLRWATPKEQAANRNKYQKHGRAVYQYSLDGTLIRRWDGLVDVVRSLGISKANISTVCSGRRPTAGGYKWKFCDQVDQQEGEEWRHIPYPEYPNVQASSLGRIQFPNGRITEGYNHGKYKRVTLVCPFDHPDIKGNKFFRVHRLVAAAFYGRNDARNIIINHKDGNPKNNRVGNLEYRTQHENCQHASQLGLLVPTKNKFKRKVIQIDLNGTIIAEYESVTQAAQQLGLRKNSIINCCAGRSKTYRSYKWQYADQ
jgi:hypothetical protein